MGIYVHSHTKKTWCFVLESVLTPHYCRALPFGHPPVSRAAWVLWSQNSCACQSEHDASRFISRGAGVWLCAVCWSPSSSSPLRPQNKLIHGQVNTTGCHVIDNTKSFASCMKSTFSQLCDIQRHHHYYVQVSPTKYLTSLMYSRQRCGLFRLIFKVFYLVLPKCGSEAGVLVTGRRPVPGNGLLLCDCMAGSRHGESEPSPSTLNNLQWN